MVRRVAVVVLALVVDTVGCASGTTIPVLDLEPNDDDGDDGGDTGGPIDPTTSLTTLGMPADETADGGDDTTGSADDVDPDGGGQCGNDTAEATEKCDGSDLAGEDCASQGFSAGTLACDAGCAEFDTRACVSYECGNDLVEGDDEVCDGEDLAGADCQSEGFDAGTLACNSDCSSLDESDCTLVSCGNDSIDRKEVCDGTDLGDQTCASQGLEGGSLACGRNCTTFDLTACLCEEEDIGNMLGAPVATGSTAAEDDSLPTSCGAGGGNDRVIAFTAPAAGDYSFDTVGSSYDTVLAAFDSCESLTELDCSDDAAGTASALSMNLAAGESILLLVDGYDGDTGTWELNVSSGGGNCDEEDIMGTVGSNVASGDLTGDDEDFSLGCGGATGSVDHVIRFAAPADATFTFDTVGSDYDTVLAVFDACSEDTELACDDDTDGVLSEVSLDLASGQEVFVIVSGYAGDVGNWQLNIAQG